MKLMKTTIKSIDIFGDSFSAQDYKLSKDDTWLDMLEKKYGFILKNNSKIGVGAQWCIEKFMGLTEYSDYLLFCLPDMNRISFEYLSENEIASANMIYTIMDKNSFDFPNTISEEIKNLSDRIYKDFNSFYTTGLHKILEVLFMSFIFTKHNKYEKILIWPSSGLGYPFRNYNSTLEVPQNVHIVTRCLNFISHFEKKGTDINKTYDKNEEGDARFFFGKDIRSNHLSFDNHKILSKQIFNFFIEHKNPVTSEFKREIYEV